MLLCARWFPSVGHSWDRSRSTWQSVQFAQSPSVLLPKLELDSVNGSGLSRVVVTVSSGSGTACGSAVTWIPSESTRVDHRVMPVILCSPELYGGAHFDGSRFWDTGLDPNLVVHISAVTSHGTINVERAIATNAPSCSGSCPLPAPDPFVIPITGGGSASVHLTLSYQGGTESGHGAATWTLGAVGGTVPTDPVPDFPQLDTDQHVTARIQVGTFAQPYPLAAVVTVPIYADRPVDYRIDLQQNGSGTACVRPGGSAVATGHLATFGSIDMPNLCLGTAYIANVTLTDAAGHRSVWGLVIGDPAHFWGNNALVTTPTLTGTLHYQFQPRDGGRMDWANVSVFGQRIDAISAAFNGFCRQDGLYDAQGNVPNFQIGQEVYAEIHFAVSRLPYAQNGACTVRSETTDEIRGDQVVTLDQLLASPDGVVMTDPKWTLKINFAVTR